MSDIASLFFIEVKKFQRIIGQLIFLFSSILFTPFAHSSCPETDEIIRQNFGSSDLLEFNGSLEELQHYKTKSGWISDFYGNIKPNSIKFVQVVLRKNSQIHANVSCQYSAITNDEKTVLFNLHQPFRDDDISTINKMPGGVWTDDNPKNSYLYPDSICKADKDDPKPSQCPFKFH